MTYPRKFAAVVLGFWFGTALADDSGVPIVKPSPDPQMVPYIGPRAVATPPLQVEATEPFPRLGGFGVDTGNRQQVQAFFNSIYTASDNTAIEFTGDVPSCSPGTTSALFKDAVLLRINWFRALAGAPDVTLRESYSSDAQDAALIMAANGTLTHFPAPGATCYTSTGNQGAQNSNLSLGNLGWDAVRGFMDDGGSGNTAVGHRRWLIHPPTLEMGSGDIPAGASNPATSAIWVIDDNVFGPVNARDGYVAWPPPGNVPYNVVPARWSFSMDNANFSAASVTMSSGGVGVPLTLEPLSNGAGLNTLVWVPMGLDPDTGETWPNPGSDTVYDVTVSNVVVGGGARVFDYSVSIFDPATSDAGDVVQTITGPASAEVGTAERYAFTPVPFAEANAFRSGRLVPFTAVEGAETGGTDTSDGTDPDYPLITTSVAAVGSASFHLAHPNAQDQDFVWERQVLLTDSSELTFFSRLGYASPAQIAKAQVSLDGGQSWVDVYVQAGTVTDPQTQSGESSFAMRTVSLAAHAGRVVNVRFAYELDNGSYFQQTDPGFGFYVDEISVTNAQELTDIVATDLGGVSSFSFTPVATGNHLLQAQFVGWTGFAGSAWGPPLEVNATTAAPGATAIAASVLPASRSVYQTTATAFATIINGGAVTALGCRIVPQTNTPSVFTYQTTDPATNALTGAPNTPVDIPAGAYQTFAIFFAPSGPFAPTDVRLSFDCANTTPAPVVSGLNSLLLASGAAPVPDVIALAAAPVPGIVEIPGATGTGVFAVATVNVGTGASITASASAPPGLGVTVNVCETDPGTGACISAVGPSVTTTIGPGATPTFGFFVTGSGGVPFDPANNRLVVTFADGGGTTRGSTSVAVRTN